MTVWRRMNRLPGALAILFVFVVAACSSGAAPLPRQDAGGTSPEPSAPASDTPVATAPSDGPDQSGDQGGNPAEPGQPRLVIPKPGQLNPHPVSIEKISARANGRHVVVNAQWWSGVEPCAVLDSTALTVDGSTITISVREGTGKGEVACIDIAVLKVTVIDLGELEPGTYRIVADDGPAEPVTITVS